MNSRKLAGASAASVGAATAVAALLLGTLSGSAGEEPSASAFGLAAEGLVPIAPTPRIEAPPDGRRAVLEVPGPRKDGLYVGLLTVEAEHYRSKAKAVKVDVLGLRLKVIEAFCDHGHGDSTILAADDKSSSSSSEAGLNLSPVVKVEFNRHRRDHDKLTVDGAVITLLPADKYGMTISPKDLGLFQSLAPKGLKIPTMDQLQAAHAKSVEAKSAEAKPFDAKPFDAKPAEAKPAEAKPFDAKPSSDAKSSTPTKSSAPEESAPTVRDLVNEVESLNPSLTRLMGGRDREALEEIVISSASCREEHHEARPPEQHKQEAPPPHPVKAHLPVTH